MCDDNPSTYRTNAKGVDMPKDRRLVAAIMMTTIMIMVGFFLGGSLGIHIGLQSVPSLPPAAKPTPTCRDSFEWITDRCSDPLKHTCEPGQKMEVKDDPGIHYMVCRCK